MDWVHTSNCCRRLEDDSESDNPIWNSTFNVQYSSIQGDPAAFTNFHSAGFGEVIGLAISIVLHVYLKETEMSFMVFKKK